MAKSPAGCVHVCNPALRRHREEDSFKSKSSLVYTVNSNPAKAVYPPTTNTPTPPQLF